jgi:hypothetical protein
VFGNQGMVHLPNKRAGALSASMVRNSGKPSVTAKYGTLVRNAGRFPNGQTDKTV